MIQAVLIGQAYWSVGIDECHQLSPTADDIPLPAESRGVVSNRMVRSRELTIKLRESMKTKVQSDFLRKQARDSFHGAPWHDSKAVVPKTISCRWLRERY